LEAGADLVFAFALAKEKAGAGVAVVDGASAPG
jgi:hypothetical protein